MVREFRELLWWVIATSDKYMVLAWVFGKLGRVAPFISKCELVLEGGRLGRAKQTTGKCRNQGGVQVMLD